MTIDRDQPSANAEATGIERRRSPRFVPTGPVGVALETGDGSKAEGIVANISATGACVSTEAALPVGETVVVQLRFPADVLPMTATGWVVWTGGANGQPRRYGLQWTHSNLQTVRLESLIQKYCVTPSGS